jgi:Na+-transporting NADH:ubiquinone oxidoreductase subunit NqrB
MDAENQTKRMKRLFGWIGAICLLLIILVKAIRWMDISFIKTIVGVAPSCLGPAGLFFLIISSTGKLSRLTQIQASIITGVVALGLEFAQLLPRPGILAKVKYTFDWLDIITSLISLLIAYIVARLLSIKNRKQS